jgi:hypothetical protein
LPLFAASVLAVVAIAVTLAGTPIVGPKLTPVNCHE